MSNFKCECERKIPRDLSRGDIVSIYIESDEESILEGEATLIERLIPTIKKEPFPYLERCETCKRQLNAIKEKWSVSFTDPFLKHLVFSRWITKFHSHGDIRINNKFDNEYLEFVDPFCIDYLEDETLCTRLRGEVLGELKPTVLLKKFLKYMKES